MSATALNTSVQAVNEEEQVKMILNFRFVMNEALWSSGSRVLVYNAEDPWSSVRDLENSPSLFLAAHPEANGYPRHFRVGEV